MSDSRADRLAKNEAVFRDVNERVEEVARTPGAAGALTEFLCECVNGDCYEHVQLSLAEYEQVRSNATHFLVAPGHVDTTIETLVRETERFAIVEKQGEAAEEAKELDPRD
jgi:hypothetical protein